VSSPITDFQGKVAVITGGASGVGRALARMLLDRGGSVVIADVEQGALDTAADELQGRGKGEAIGVLCDVTDYTSVEALAERAYTHFGKVNLVFNNAGVGSPQAKVWETTPNDWRWVTEVNLYGVAYGCIAFAPRMIESGEPGYIVNTTSGDGAIAPLPGASVYAASKAGVAITTECLARNLDEVGANIRAGLLFPSGRGLISTGMWTADRNRPEKWTRERERPPLDPDIEAMKQRATEAAKANKEMFEGELDALANAVLDGIVAGNYVLTLGEFESSAQRLRQRADNYAQLKSPGEGDGGH
jgi:NAD(P)-dependent dehydrogenase (short-subunit alcohol dehydrogenase family)